MDTFDVTQENQQKTLESMTREFAKAMASAKKHEKTDTIGNSLDI